MSATFGLVYGHYLRVTGANHPGHKDIITAMNCDGDAVMHDLLAEPDAMPDRRLFMKHMAHHLVDLDLAFLHMTQNIFLIRNPREMLPSLTVQLPDAELSDTGLKRQWGQRLLGTRVDAHDGVRWSGGQEVAGSNPASPTKQNHL